LRKENEGCILVKKQTNMALKEQVKTNKVTLNVLDTFKETKRRPSTHLETNIVQEKNVSNGIFPLSDSRGRTLSEKEVFIPAPDDCWI
jgi:hypothetical protein